MDGEHKYENIDKFNALKVFLSAMLFKSIFFRRAFQLILQLLLENIDRRKVSACIGRDSKNILLKDGIYSPTYNPTLKYFYPVFSSPDNSRRTNVRIRNKSGEEFMTRFYSFLLRLTYCIE